MTNTAVDITDNTPLISRILQLYINDTASVISPIVPLISLTTPRISTILPLISPIQPLISTILPLITVEY